jgi:hypothetical protein
MKLGLEEDSTNAGYTQNAREYVNVHNAVFDSAF